MLVVNFQIFKFQSEEIMMTEDQIENVFESSMDSLDKQFLNNIITEEEYNLSVERLKNWATHKLILLQLPQPAFQVQ